MYARLKIPEGSVGRSFAPLEKFQGAARSIAGRFVLPNVDEANTARTVTLPVATGFDALN